jgi:hypothetical protein
MRSCSLSESRTQRVARERIRERGGAPLVNAKIVKQVKARLSKELVLE